MKRKATAKPYTAAIIPARYASTRLPGKPLALIAGKPMIQHTYERVKQAKLPDVVVVATDDERIVRAVEAFGGVAVMTSEACLNGTVRCHEALQRMLRGADVKYVINVQGDEPLVEPTHVDRLLQALYDATDDATRVGAMAAPIRTCDEVLSTAVTKVVMDRAHRALYFSRAMIPHSKSGEWHAATAYYRNCGMYAFKRRFLDELCAERVVGALQAEEDLEQLKVLEMGARIQMVVVDEAVGGIDLPHQLEELRKQLGGE